jgi:hypothetical protein
MMVALASHPLAQDRVDNRAAGVSIGRPAGWQGATVAQVQANRERVRLSDAEMQQGLVNRAALPLIVLMKYPEPHPGLNPAIQITLRQNLAGTPTQLLEGALTTMRRGFSDLRIIEEAQPTDVAGLPGASVRVTYTLRTDTLAEPVLSRLWLVPRGSLMFLIGMAGTQSGPDVCEQEFMDALRSLRIDR